MSESEAESVGEIENDGVEIDVDILTDDGVIVHPQINLCPLLQCYHIYQLY